MVLMDLITSPQLFQHRDIMNQWVHYLLYQRSTTIYENIVVSDLQLRRLVSWFAPVDKEEENQTFLHGIGENLYRIYSAPWFVGHYHRDKVVNLLDREEQTENQFFYLVRLNSNDESIWDCPFTISIFNKSQIFHIRVWREPTQGFYLKTDSGPLFMRPDLYTLINDLSCLGEGDKKRYGMEISLGKIPKAVQTVNRMEGAYQRL
eukprot:TRINITY_DN2038_c0_g1_i10.p2 TRINITY_DN2038_c0_g1~~TRINITY_DN2038_c0_g1_i10.p2  ORF type:complete len:205 (+),score=32.48 TRINITY_DN2038_c0_g1_i10:1255-1869(+)